jgi:hypothetical protein
VSRVRRSVLEQRLRRLDPGDAAGGDVARHRGDERQAGRDRAEREGVERETPTSTPPTTRLAR